VLFRSEIVIDERNTSITKVVAFPEQKSKVLEVEKAVTTLPTEPRRTRKTQPKIAIEDLEPSVTKLPASSVTEVIEKHSDEQPKAKEIISSVTSESKKTEIIQQEQPKVAIDEREPSVYEKAVTALPTQSRRTRKTQPKTDIEELQPSGTKLSSSSVPEKLSEEKQSVQEKEPTATLSVESRRTRKTQSKTVTADSQTSAIESVASSVPEVIDKQLKVKADDPVVAPRRTRNAKQEGPIASIVEHEPSLSDLPVTSVHEAIENVVEPESILTSEYEKSRKNDVTQSETATIECELSVNEFVEKKPIVSTKETVSTLPLESKKTRKTQQNQPKTANEESDISVSELPVPLGVDVVKKLPAKQIKNKAEDTISTVTTETKRTTRHTQHKTEIDVEPKVSVPEKIAPTQSEPTISKNTRKSSKKEPDVAFEEAELLANQSTVSKKRPNNVIEEPERTSNENLKKASKKHVEEVVAPDTSIPIKIEKTPKKRPNEEITLAAETLGTTTVGSVFSGSVKKMRSPKVRAAKKAL